MVADCFQSRTSLRGVEPLLVRACRLELVERTPVWFMRQAGRSLPEYRELRNRYGLFDIVAQPELCAEVTLQPVRRHDVDAAVMFTDIMFPVLGMGIEVELVENVGPVISKPIRTRADVDRLVVPEPEASVPTILEAVRLVRAALRDDQAVIGFCGGPFTVAGYLIEGKPSREFATVKEMMYREPETWHALMNKLADTFERYIAAKARAGADVIQVFDSWVGALSPSDYEEFVAPYSARIFAAVGVPTIHFGTGTATLADVPAYYADIRGGRPIPPAVLQDLVERYRRLGIEDESPLNAITAETRAALERKLGDVPVFTGMKHWTPHIAEATEAAVASGADTVVGLVLAPHYSSMSIAGYRQQLERGLGGRVELAFIESWHDEPGFVDLLAERLRGTDAHVVFTAHSLPARILVAGDPYKDQLLETSQLVAERAALETWSFSFQSESQTGEPWLGPDILDHLRELHGRGVREVLVCPVGFVADHLEIRWDLDHEAAELAGELGIGFRRIEMPNADPAFVQVLAALVRRVLAVPSEA